MSQTETKHAPLHPVDHGVFQVAGSLSYPDNFKSYHDIFSQGLGYS